MREYQQKKKPRVFQTYDINIDSYPHFGKDGKIQGGVEKKTWWLEETHAVQLLSLKYQSEPISVFKNI